MLAVLLKVTVPVCPHCGAACDEVHQARDSGGVRDLPRGGRAVELRVRIAQLWCSPCGRQFAPTVPS
jgi:transposase